MKMGMKIRLLVSVTLAVVLLSGKAFGADVWKYITVKIGEAAVKHKDADLSFYNGADEIYPITYNDVVYVPLKAFADSVGVPCEWDEETQTAVYEIGPEHYKAHELLDTITYQTGIKAVCGDESGYRTSLTPGPYYAEVGNKVYFLADTNGAYNYEIWVYDKDTLKAERVVAGFSSIAYIESANAKGEVGFVESNGVGMSHYDIRTLKYSGGQVTVESFSYGRITGDMSAEIAGQKSVVYNAQYLKRHANASDILMASDTQSYDIYNQYLYAMSKAKPVGGSNAGFIYEIGVYDLDTFSYTPLLYKNADISRHAAYSGGLWTDEVEHTANELMIMESDDTVLTYSIKDKAFADRAQTDWKVY